MKTMVLLATFAATACLAQDTNEITTKVFERDKDKDGKIDVRMETTYRGQTKVMMVLQTRNPRGVLTTGRSFFVDGKLAVTESDEDGDGHFELFVLRKDESRDVEVFNRQKDGSAKPVSNEALAIWKRLNATQDDIGKTMRDLIEGKSTPEQAAEEVLRIKAKVAELERQRLEAEKRDK